MTRLILALAAIVLLAAATATPVKITADKFVVTESEKQATFTGNVVVIRGTMTVWAPKVVVDYGEGGPSNIKTFTASGGVKIKTTDQTATGATARYDPSTQILRLSGDVTVVNASGTLKGPELVLNLSTNTSTFSSNGGGRVTGVFTPQ